MVMSSVDYQKHLKSLLEQKETISNEIESKRILLFKVVGAIEYLTEIGVSLDSSEEKTPETTTEPEVVE
tara:strand:+ start:1202 stop:1408 length:207 start_codon:yes stop_codon:yes gene_type:complete